MMIRLTFARVYSLVGRPPPTGQPTAAEVVRTTGFRRAVIRFFFLLLLTLPYRIEIRFHGLNGSGINIFISRDDYDFRTFQERISRIRRHFQLDGIENRKIMP